MHKLKSTGTQTDSTKVQKPAAHALQPQQNNPWFNTPVGGLVVYIRMRADVFRRIPRLNFVAELMLEAKLL